MSARASLAPVSTSPAGHQDGDAKSYERGRYEPRRQRYLVQGDIQPLHEAGRNQTGAEPEGPPVHLQGQQAAHQLDTERDDAYTKQTHAPADVREKSDPDPNEERALAGCIDHPSRDTLRFHGSTLLTGVHASPPFRR